MNKVPAVTDFNLSGGTGISPSVSLQLTPPSSEGGSKQKGNRGARSESLWEKYIKQAAENSYNIRRETALKNDGYFKELADGSNISSDRRAFLENELNLYARDDKYRYWGRNLREAQQREKDEFNRLSALVKTPEWKMMTPEQQAAERAKLEGARTGVTKARQDYVADEEKREDFKLGQAWKATDMYGNVLPNAGEIRGEYIKKGQQNPDNPLRNTQYGDDTLLYDNHPYGVNEEEKEYINFLYGFYDAEKAEKIMLSYLNERGRKNLSELAKENSIEGFLYRNFMAPAVNVMGNLAAYPRYAVEAGIQGAKNVISGLPRKMDPYSVGAELIKTTDASRDAFVGDRKVKGLVLDTVNSVTPAVFGVAAPVVYGMQSGGRSAYEVSEKGGSAGQAAFSGILNGTLSYFLSKKGFDELFKGGEAAKNALKGDLKNTLFEMFVKHPARLGRAEALEEGFESYAGTVIDLLVNGDNSDMARLYNAHIKNGHTPQEAQRMTLTAKLLTEPSVYAALGGLMGAFMGEVNTVAGTGKALYDYKNAPGSVSVNVGGYAIREGMSDAQVLELVRSLPQSAMPTAPSSEGAGMQYKIMESKENGKVAFLDGKILGKRDGETRSQSIRRVFNENFKNKPITVDETQDNVGMDQIGKYIYPGKEVDKYNQKIAAVPVINEIIQIGSNRRWSKNLLDKNGNVKKHGNLDCSNGFYYYDTKFVIDNSGIIYGGIVIVRLDKNGKAYFYDLDNVREVGYQDENEFYPVEKSSLSTSLTENSIPHNKEGVNTFQNKVITPHPSAEADTFSSRGRLGETMELKERGAFESDEAYAHYLNGIAQSVFAKASREMLNYAEAVAKNTGIKFVIGDTGYITGVESAGAYSWKDDMVLLDYDTLQSPEKLARAVINHELVHPAETSMFYKRLEKYAFEQMFGGNEKALNEAIKKKQQRYAKSGVKLGEKRAKAELVASYIGESILTSEAAVNRLVIEKPDIAVQIRDALIKAYDRAKTYFTDKEAYEAKYVLSDLEKGIKFFEKALYTRRNFKDFIKRLSGNSDGDMRYDITVTRDDVQTLQNIGKIKGRISINDFDARDISATENFAKKYNKELGVKSPFFRAYFGDWRANEKNPVKIATRKGNKRGITKNVDTGWDIQVSGKVFSETTTHKNKQSNNAVPYLPYINSIVENAVLLDSCTIDKPKSHNSAIMHSLYSVADIGNGKEVLKLFVEELNDVNSDGTIKRSYKLIMPAASARVQGSLSSVTNTASNIKTISDLFNFVKQNDKDFNPKQSSLVVNEDGTPKVVYHGTDKNFTTFSSADDAYWFSESYDYAESIAGERGGKNVMPVYLDMKNPYYAKLPEGKFSDPAAEKSIIAKAKANRNDGVIIECDTDNELVYDKFYVVFEPSQIKSATDNIGTYDRRNNDFQFAKPIAHGTREQGGVDNKNAEATDNRTADIEKIDGSRNITSTPEIITEDVNVVKNDSRFAKPVAEIQEDDEIYLTDEQDYDRRLYFLKSIKEFEKRMEDEGFPDYYIDKVYNQLNYAMMCGYEGDYSVFTHVLPGVDIKAVKKTVLTGDLTHIFGKKK